MIHIDFGPRQSGKTTRLLAQNQKNSGLVIVHKHPWMFTPFINTYMIEERDLSIRRIKDFKYIYIDEIFLMRRINFQYVMEWDNQGHEIYITGTPTEPLPEYFHYYLTTNYPEQLI